MLTSRIAATDQTVGLNDRFEIDHTTLQVDHSLEAGLVPMSGRGDEGDRSAT